MPVNANKPHLWKADIARSVDFYNSWFMKFAPRTFRAERKKISETVSQDIKKTKDFTKLNPQTLKDHPSVLPILRMSTAPPIARDRVSGLAYVSRSMINRMERDGKLPARMSEGDLNAALSRIIDVIVKLLDQDIFPWLESKTSATPRERERAASIIADRLTGAISDPIIRNGQERRQLRAIEGFLNGRGYKKRSLPSNKALKAMPPGTFTFRRNVVAGGQRRVNIPIDAIVQPKNLPAGRLPILIEAKSAGDFTNVNKRRKEEATKMRHLQETYGKKVRFVLFLNGYFDTSYLGYEAAEGIDWIWEHRITDLVEFGI